MCYNLTLKKLFSMLTNVKTNHHSCSFNFVLFGGKKNIPFLIVWEVSNQRLPVLFFFKLYFQTTLTGT